MMLRLINRGKRIAAFLRPLGVPLHSAYTAFFLILSLFPSLLLLLGILRYTRFDAADLMSLLEGFLPESLYGAAHMLVQASYRHSSSAVISLSVIAGLWSASRGMYGLVRGLNRIYGEGTGKGYLRSRVISVCYTSLFLALLVLTLVLHVFGTALVDFLWMTTDPVVMAVMNLIDLRFLLLLLLQTALFTAMYAWLPWKRNRVRDSLPGAVVASLGWTVYSKLFSVYVAHFSSYTNIFGSIYSLALGMLWLYFCICILFYGAALNRWLEGSPGDSFQTE